MYEIVMLIIYGIMQLSSIIFTFSSSIDTEQPIHEQKIKEDKIFEKNLVKDYISVNVSRMNKAMSELGMVIDIRLDNIDSTCIFEVNSKLNNFTSFIVDSKSCEDLSIEEINKNIIKVFNNEYLYTKI